MPFDLARFTSELSKHGIIQTNRFEVTIENQNFPNNLFNSNIIPQEQLTAARMAFTILKDRIESVKLPGLLIDTVASARYGVGPSISSGTNVRFDPLSITILSDRDMIAHKFFVAWFNYIFDGMSTSRNSTPTFLNAYKEDYSATISVKVFNNSGTIAVADTNISSAADTYAFYEAFPISISEPTLSWSSNNNLYRFDVNFLYTNWTTELPNNQN